MTGESPAEGSVVLYPSPGMGHLVSMIELAKLLLIQGLPVTVIIVEPHYNTGSTAPFIARVSAANPSIAFHRLPPVVSLPPNPSPHHEALAFDLLRLSNPGLKDFLASSSPRALVIDGFCGFALDVAAEHGLPTYYFYTSGASALAVFIHFPELHDASAKSFRELGPTLLQIPGVPPLPADHMTLPMLDRDDDAYRGFLYNSRRFTEAAGIIINTFEALEERAVKALSAGLCVTDGRPTPPLYCIGPLINSREQISGVDCLAWLDKQPRGSVVFLCFGSLGLFSEEQLKEIAVGLERSGQRFLWVVRSPPSGEPGKRFKAPPEPDLERLLPEGFLERTRGQGMVVKQWAPQVAVLSHEAVGGFVKHCGWNSVLEATLAGVPMIGWPLYAEQWMNKVFLVEELKLAVEMRGYDTELVSAGEVGGKLRWLMESEGGKELRERMVKAKESAAAALTGGGSSKVALEEVVARLKGTE